MKMTKVKSCYPNKEAMKNRNPRCPNHYWGSLGYGYCKLTDKIVKPETCGMSSEWERDA